MAAILAPSPHHPVVGDRRPDLHLVPGGAAGRTDRTATHRRRRLVAGLLAEVLLTGLVVGSRALLAPLAEPAVAGPAATAADPGDASVVGAPGDTYWSIARCIQPTGEVRPLVDVLVRANGACPIQPGDTVVVPVSIAPGPGSHSFTWVRRPACGNLHHRVVDSRTSDYGTAIRRRRECSTCSRRFTTFERADELPLVVRSGRATVSPSTAPDRGRAGGGGQEPPGGHRWSRAARRRSRGALPPGGR